MGEPQRPYQGRRGTGTNGRRILTQVDVEEDMMRLSREIDDLLEDLEDTAAAKAQAEYNWELFRARNGLVASAEPGNGPGGRTTVDEREARVIERDKDHLFLEHLRTEALYEVTKERIHAKRDQLKSLQTISANLRAVLTTGA